MHPYIIPAARLAVELVNESVATRARQRRIGQRVVYDVVNIASEEQKGSSRTPSSLYSPHSPHLSHSSHSPHSPHSPHSSNSSNSSHTPHTTHTPRRHHPQHSAEASKTSLTNDEACMLGLDCPGIVQCAQQCTSTLTSAREYFYDDVEHDGWSGLCHYFPLLGFAGVMDLFEVHCTFWSLYTQTLGGYAVGHTRYPLDCATVELKDLVYTGEGKAHPLVPLKYLLDAYTQWKTRACKDGTRREARMHPGSIPSCSSSGVPLVSSYESLLTLHQWLGHNNEIQAIVSGILTLYAVHRLKRREPLYQLEDAIVTVRLADHTDVEHRPGKFTISRGPQTWCDGWNTPSTLHPFLSGLPRGGDYIQDGVRSSSWLDVQGRGWVMCIVERMEHGVRTSLAFSVPLSHLSSVLVAAPDQEHEDVLDQNRQRTRDAHRLDALELSADACAPHGTPEGTLVEIMDVHVHTKQRRVAAGSEHILVQALEDLQIARTEVRMPAGFAVHVGSAAHAGMNPGEDESGGVHGAGSLQNGKKNVNRVSSVAYDGVLRKIGFAL